MKNIESEIIHYGNLCAKYTHLLRESGGNYTDDSVIDIASKISEQLKKISFMLADKLTDKLVIEQLSKYFNAYQEKHTVVKQRCSDVSIWKENGRPFEWQLVEQDFEHSVYLDTGYGHLALFENGKLVGVGKETITTENCVVICRDYFSTKKYIWK